MVMYEKPIDRLNEEQILWKVLTLIGGTDYAKLPISYALDFAVLTPSDKIIHFVEVKCRPTLQWGRPGGYFLSAAKVIKARQLFHTTGIPCWLAVQPADGHVYWCDILGHTPGAVLFGRHDRPDDDQAIEPCVSYNWDMFKRVPS